MTNLIFYMKTKNIAECPQNVIEINLYMSNDKIYMKYSINIQLYDLK